MSAIGDYIHYRAENYRKYGIAYSGEKRENALLDSQMLKTQKDNLLERVNKVGSRVKDKDLRDIEQTIDSFRVSNDFKAGSPAFEAYKAYLEKTFPDLIGLISTMDHKLGAVPNYKELMEKGISKVSSTMVSKKGAKQKMNSFEVKEITDKLNKLETEMIEQGLEGHADYQKLVNTLKQTYDNAYKKLEASTKGNPELTTLLTEDFAAVKKATGMSMSDFKKTFNQLINDYAKLPAFAGVEGLAFEEVIALALAEADKTAIDALDAVVGGLSNKQTFQYDIDKFAMFSDKSSIKQEFSDGSSISANINKRSKVDVRLSWKNYEDLKISAKSIRYKDSQGLKWLSTVGRTTFLSLIQDIDPYLVNHWLNLHAKFEEDKLGQIADKAEVNKLMKAYLFYKTISGDVYGMGNNMAEVFIVNNKKTGKTVARTIGDICKKMIQNNFKKLQNVKMQLNGTGINSVAIENKFVQWEAEDGSHTNKKHRYGALRRVSNILVTTHQIKVSAGFEMSLLY